MKASPDVFRFATTKVCVSRGERSGRGDADTGFGEGASISGLLSFRLLLLAVG